jgi:hypothetical protein
MFEIGPNTADTIVKVSCVLTFMVLFICIAWSTK